MGVLEGIEPRGVWHWFEEVCAIPRPSGSEGRMADFLESFARARGLDSARDLADNVIIRVPGRGAPAGRPALLLQAHVDLVPEKTPQSSHDFYTDPIVPVVSGDWVTSPETTLGADNGIGVALMLAVLDSTDLAHPPLECLFTTDEERGLTGAASLDPGWISARRLVNLDSEDEGVFCIGCAGGVDLTVELPLERCAAEGSIMRLEVSGLKGGHSGMEIDKDRGNAIVFLARALLPLCRDRGCLIAGLEGGSKRNAIPRSASATIVVPDRSAAEVREEISRMERELKEEFLGTEDSIEIGLTPGVSDLEPLTEGSGNTVVRFLLALPHGVRKMSGLVRGLVDTSVNLAIASISDGTLGIILSARSPLESAKRALADSVNAIAVLSGAGFASGDGYPGWQPDPSSALLAAASAVYVSELGSEPVVETIHAGLECGIIGDRVGGMDMISIGPDIRGVHVPGERVSIPSLQRFWRFFVALLERLDGDT